MGSMAGDEEREKRMEEEIICNRWKDLADEPIVKKRWSVHQPVLSLPSATAVT
jgi:hypothetical protein